MRRIAGISEPPPGRPDYYAILGLPPQANGSEIRQAYWQLARRYHALASSELLASTMLDDLNDAAEVLGTAALRRDYDASRQGLVDCGHARAAATRTTQAVAASRGRVIPAVRRIAALRRHCILILLIAVAGIASAPATAGTGSNDTKIVRGASVTSAPIVFVGDSITHGAGATSVNATFAHLLRQRLDDAGFANGPDDYESVISALGGQFIDLRFSQDVGRHPRSLVVVEVGAHSVVEDQGLSSGQFRMGYGLMLDCLQGSGGTVVVSTVPWLGWDQTDPVYARAADRSAIIREEAAGRGIPVADLWNALKDRWDLLALDKFHPNDAGHRLIADLLWSQIEPQAGRPRGAFVDRCDYDRVLALRANHSNIVSPSVTGG